ncbi:MAG: polymer-forming cytoskeletal protein [Campylobacterales bacterium]
MAIFGSNDNAGSKPAKTAVANSNTTIITAGAELKGEIALECDVYFDGRMEGTIHSKGVITVGKNGTVKGDIDAAHLVVQGRVEGNVEVDRLEIKENGYVSGVVTSTEMVIEAKGVFEGESHRKSASAPKPAKPDVDKKS